MYTRGLLLILCSVSFEASADPQTALRSVAPGEWITYRVELEDPLRASCCFELTHRTVGKRGCLLVEGPRSYGWSDSDRPEPHEALQIFLRRGGKSFDRVLAVGSSCSVDTVDERVTRFEKISTGSSIAFFEETADNESLPALAQHKGGGPALIRLSKHRDEDLRGESMFWLGQTQHLDTETALLAAIFNDSSSEVRKKAVFALSQLPPKRAIPVLRGLVDARHPREVRKEALFWLAQIRDDAVLAVFDELLASPR
jgi:hypothetical protein